MFKLKHHWLNEAISQGFLKSSSKHRIKFAYIFADKMRGAFALQKLLTFFQQKISVLLHTMRLKI